MTYTLPVTCCMMGAALALPCCVLRFAMLQNLEHWGLPVEQAFLTAAFNKQTPTDNKQSSAVTALAWHTQHARLGLGPPPLKHQLCSREEHHKHCNDKAWPAD